VSLAAARLRLAVLAVPWKPWSARERLEPSPDSSSPDLSGVTALIPARNEAAVIGETLAALAAQGEGLRAVEVDGQSLDGTEEAALAVGMEGLEVPAGQPLPYGWTGKMWALARRVKARGGRKPTPA
jgi:hypothetical protein